MSFTTPLSITINSVATNFHRIVPGENSSTYQTEAGNDTLKISHQETKSRVRHLARLDRDVVAADPLTAVNASKSAAVYIVIDEPDFGFSNADLVTMTQEFLSFLTAGNLAIIVANRH